MRWTSIISLALFTPSAFANTILRFSCSQLVRERLDPLVFPGSNPSPHVHQVVGGNSFNVTMNYPGHDLVGLSSCTTCTFTQDFSNYWTATLWFQARNGSFYPVPQKGNVDFESANGGMTVYYIAPYDGSSVTAFAPGFRMIVGNPTFRTAQQASIYRQLTFTCLQTPDDRTDETQAMPTKPCPAGILANIRFPTCWDGVNLDSSDHASHVAYPSGTFENNGACPSSHPVKIPQLFYEVYWDTTGFNDQSEWPTDGSQPFVWAYGDPTGYGTHGDYMFGWQGNALQNAMDANCDVTCPTLSSQSISAANGCTQQPVVNEVITGWLSKLPGNNPVTGGTSTGSSPPPSGTTTAVTPPSGGCTSAQYGQCGGIGWTGCTTCASPYTCKVSNDYYSQCL